MKTRWSPSRIMEISFLISVLFLANVACIKVSFGTNDGPIVPPPPSTPRPPPQQPYRVPAAVWEDNVDDIPNPNPYKAPVLPHLAHWLSNKGSSVPSTSTQKPTVQPTQASYAPTSSPQYNSKPGHTRYTQVIFNRPHPAPAPSTTLSPAKAFVNAYARTTKPTQAPTVPTQQYQTSAPQQRQEENFQRLDYHNEGLRHYNDFRQQVPELGIRYIPGFGFKYFTPEQDRIDPRKDYRYNTHDKYNSLGSNDIFANHQHQNDIDLSYDKFLAQRVKKSPVAQTYVPQTFAYYQQRLPQQLFYPAQLYSNPGH